ncbi:MAG: hypothetical protein DM484_12580 [Candidatus Methylumidiphilus alinenensis]|uniref:Uncharacterized protein n=1 Tax=Candidatus Methylumidiphilus alinenensis TaxID=2202197 RepID=A0A2W4T7G6_9GAMM|nr:MAG: hypothetical protein DM484_12580 [Candidatus Methylumidiphilus alinenensis]
MEATAYRWVLRKVMSTSKGQAGAWRSQKERQAPAWQGFAEELFVIFVDNSFRFWWIHYWKSPTIGY